MWNHNSNIAISVQEGAEHQGNAIVVYPGWEHLSASKKKGSLNLLHQSYIWESYFRDSEKDEK